MRPRWDIFCKVVDNYGDAGVCWRLARQLAAEHDIAPRLWVDGLGTLARLAPGVHPDHAEQTVSGVEIRRWPDPFPTVEPGAVVLETFGCDVPAGFAEHMVRAERLPVWINLEHLSAEPWVDDCHLLPSPHPRLPITRWFFYPGFSDRTGGLLRERGLLEARDRFQSDGAAQTALWSELGLPSRIGAELRLLIFCYDTPAAAALFEALATGPQPVRAIVPEGVASRALAAAFGPPAAASSFLEKQSLTIHRVPFMAQDRWDRALWACDVNIVRGEDSFVRAQWAGRPLVWAIYPQSDGAHRKKMSSFLERYISGLPEPAARALNRLHNAWDAGTGLVSAWHQFAECLPDVTAHAVRWARIQANRPDLASNIIEFASRV